MMVTVEVGEDAVPVGRAGASLIEVVVEPGGIGDVMTALPTVCGLFRERRDVVRMVVKPGVVEWARLGWPLVAEEALGSGRVVRLPGTERAEVELPSQVPRHRAYAALAGVEPVRPKLRWDAASDRWADGESRSHKNRMAILAPLSNGPDRQFPMSRWVHLEDRLIREGYSPCILGGADDESRLADLRSPRHLGLAPQVVAALLSRAGVVIGGDSGVAHLAGTLQVPTVVLAGPTFGELVFDWYPTVSSLQGDLGCSPCYWLPRHGYTAPCRIQCDALASISVDRVVEAVHAQAQTAAQS